MRKTMKSRPTPIMSDGARVHVARGFRQAGFCTIPGWSSPACNPHIFIIRAQAPNALLLRARDKHAPVICSFVLHLICRFFSRFSLWNPLCFQRQIPALFWGMTRSAAGFTPAFLLDIGLTCSKMSRGNSRKKPQFFFWWDKVSHK